MPEDNDFAAPSAESRCPQCGGLRYRGPYGETCPRCLILFSVQSRVTESGASNEENAAEIAESERARRFDHFEVALHPDQTWWELERDAISPIYRAIDIESLATVALRIIDLQGADARARETIFHHAMDVSRLHHPNVARIVHFGVNANAKGILVSELPDGEPLPSIIRRAGPLPTPHVLEIAAQVAQALLAADEHRLQHGNLCPGSILLGLNAKAKAAMISVREFGVAAWFRHVNAEFACPEFLAGEKTDARSDFYSLGATLYFLLSGMPPRAHGIASRIHFTPLRERGVSEEVVIWLRRLLEPNPAHRPKDAYVLVDSIAKLRTRIKQSGAKVAAGSPTSPTRRWQSWFGQGEK